MLIDDNNPGTGVNLGLVLAEFRQCLERVATIFAREHHHLLTSALHLFLLLLLLPFQCSRSHAICTGTAAMDRHVRLGVVALRKSAPANRTFVRLFASVYAPVATQVRLLCESPVTLVARVRSFASVRAQMQPEHVAVEEPFAALSTAESAKRFAVIGSIGMVAHVLVHVTALSKSPIAQWTSEWPFAGVKAHVRLEIVALGETPTARRARERSLTSMSPFVTL